jgi:hypothetical protein
LLLSPETLMATWPRSSAAGSISAGSKPMRNPAPGCADASALESAPSGMAFSQSRPFWLPAPRAVNSWIDVGSSAVGTWLVGTSVSARSRRGAEPDTRPASIVRTAWRREMRNGAAGGPFMSRRDRWLRCMA